MNSSDDYAAMCSELPRAVWKSKHLGRRTNGDSTALTDAVSDPSPTVASAKEYLGL